MLLNYLFLFLDLLWTTLSLVNDYTGWRYNDAVDQKSYSIDDFIVLVLFYKF